MQAEGIQYNEENCRSNRHRKRQSKFRHKQKERRDRKTTYK